MNVFINIFFIFLYLIAIFLVGIPRISNESYIGNKAIIFGLLFVYQYMIMIISRLIQKCKVDFEEILKISIETAIIGVIGYSIFVDLRISEAFSGISDISYPKQALYLSLIIIVMMILINTIKLTFGYQPYDCIKYDTKDSKNI